MANTHELGIRFDTMSRSFTPVPDVPERPVDATTTRSLLKRPRREKVGSDAFNLEYDSTPTRAELKRDIVSYLGEYRLQVQKYQYDLIYGRDRLNSGEITLRDQDRGESLHIKSQRTLQSRTQEEKPIHREMAEEQGLRTFNNQLKNAQDGDTVIWASPPGPKEQGYGEYGFLFTGKVQTLHDGEKHVAMTAIRLEKPKEIADQDPWLYRFSNVVNALTGENRDFSSPEAFLSSPKVINNNISTRTIDELLQKSFAFTPNPKERINMAAIIKKMDPLIEEFADIMETGSKQDRLRAFYALENYALELKKKSEEDDHETIIYQSDTAPKVKLGRLMHTHGHVPPPVAGSCGDTEKKSNNLSIFSGGGIVGMAESDEYGSLNFTCTEGHPNKRPRGGRITECAYENCTGSVGC